MSKGFWIGSIFLVLVGSAALAYRVRRAHRTMDVATVKQQISEHLPLGSSKEEVERYLDQRSLPHSYTGESPDDRYRNTEAAIIPASKGAIVRGDIQVIFKFNDQGQLASYTVRELFTGP